MWPQNTTPNQLNIYILIVKQYWLGIAKIKNVFRSIFNPSIKIFNKYEILDFSTDLLILTWFSLWDMKIAEALFTLFLAYNVMKRVGRCVNHRYRERASITMLKQGHYGFDVSRYGACLYFFFRFLKQYAWINQPWLSYMFLKKVKRKICNFTVIRKTKG